MSVQYQLSDSIGVPIADSYTNSFQSLLEVKWVLRIFFYCFKKSTFKRYNCVLCEFPLCVCDVCGRSVFGLSGVWGVTGQFGDSHHQLRQSPSPHWDNHRHHTELNTTQVCVHHIADIKTNQSWILSFSVLPTNLFRENYNSLSQVLRLISFGNNNDDAKFPWEGRLC